VSGCDPRVAVEPAVAPDRPTTVAELLKLYRTRYVDVESLKSRVGMVSQVNVLTAHLGQLSATALERPDAIEDFKRRYADRAVATRNRYLARLRSSLQLGDGPGSPQGDAVPPSRSADPCEE
jgi:hypothetical protein